VAEELKRQEAIEKDNKKRRDGPTTAWFGKTGCDTPLALLNAMTDRLKKETKPRWVFIAGDMSAHKLTTIPGAQALAIQTVSQALQVTFPSTPLYFALGNNDALSKNYVFTCGPDNQWFNYMYSLWEKYIPADQKDTFLQMGGYAVSLTHNLRLLVLNTVLYSLNDTPHLEDADPCGQFEWLENHLIDAKKKGHHVYLLGHILPGIDSYGYTPLWADSHNSKYIEITSKYRSVISAQLYGHLHQDEFRVFNSPDKNGESRLTSNMATSAISPIYGNNPNYRNMRYGEDYKIQDYEVDYLLLDESNAAKTPIWSTLYEYLDTYKTFGATSMGLYKVYEQIGADEDAFAAWYSYRHGVPVGASPSLGSTSWVCERCAIVSIDQTSFENCIAAQGVSQPECAEVH